LSVPSKTLCNVFAGVATSLILRLVVLLFISCHLIDNKTGRLEKIYVCTVIIILFSGSKPFDVARSHFLLVPYSAYFSRYGTRNLVVHGTTGSLPVTGDSIYLALCIMWTTSKSITY
jgi:hypothetical protein